MTEAAHRRERIGCLRRGLIEHPFAAIFAAALLVRLTNIALLEGHDAFFAEADTIRYWALGGALSQRSSFWPALLSMADRMPLYPLLLGAIQSVFGDAPRLVALTQAVVDAATCVLIARLGTFVAPRVGIIAGVLAACSVTLVVVSSQILTETVFLFLYTLMLVTAAQFVLAPTPSLAYFSGLTGGLALAVRPVVGPLMVAATPVVFVVALARGRGFAAALAAMALFVVGFGAPIAPVLLRNAVWYDSWSLTTESGDHLAFWIVPLVKQRVDGTPYRVTLDRSEAQIQRRLADRGLSVASNPFQVAAVKSEIAWEQMERLPFAAYGKAWFEGAIVNLAAPALLVDPRVRALPKPSFYSTPGVSLWQRAYKYIVDDFGFYQLLLILGVVSMLPFLVLAAAGLVMLARALPWAALFACSVLAYFLLISGPVAAPKYRVPIEPVLDVLCAVALATMTGTKIARNRAAG